MTRPAWWRAWAAAALFSGLTGCATVAPPPTPRPAGPAPETSAVPEARCDAQAARFAIGQTSTPQLEAAAAYRAGASTARALRPGQAVTLDFNGGRLNLDVNAQGRVTGLRCG